jgi:hypothetical protein
VRFGEKLRSKSGAAEKKIALIEKKNPTWEDLAADWGQQVEMTFTPVRSPRNL